MTKEKMSGGKTKQEWQQRKAKLIAWDPESLKLLKTIHSELQEIDEHIVALDSLIASN